MKLIQTILTFFAFAFAAQAQPWEGKFEQLEHILPTPNAYRTASGAPGHEYWQQRADYDISVTLNEKTHEIVGEEWITYTNHSPDHLQYLWLQLDQNIMAEGNSTDLTKNFAIKDSLSANLYQSSLDLYEKHGGYTIYKVLDENKKPLPFTVNKTMMRLELPQMLTPGKSFKFYISWSYPMSDRLNESEVGKRGGMEFFPEDGNYIYLVTHWFPRMCVYDDATGWQNKQFLGSGEFALPFGNYTVRITAPADHIVAATGVLKNPSAVLTTKEVQRFEAAKKSFDRPIFIVTEQEARLKEKTKQEKTSTWEFVAENVRDFAFTSSRKFIWEAQAVRTGKTTPLAMAIYPKEGNPLWEKDGILAVKNTLEVYSARTFDYPYPVAIAVHSAGIGMEYPMICFNYGRPNKDGSYTTQKRMGMIGVTIHEVGHNFFPMIVNSDERQWGWMDEGLNTFLEKETIVERYPELNFTWGTPQSVISYMKGSKDVQRPIMTNPEQIGSQLGYNAYGKPSAALTVLRETVMGPELFDRAFKTYAQRWAFKHPKPADFFRTMEDASGVDLDWFWRGWFYSTDHVDVSLSSVRWFTVKENAAPIENKSKSTTSLNKPNTKDLSAGPTQISITNSSQASHGEFLGKINDEGIRQKLYGKNLYELTFENKGGLVSPLVIEWTYEDNSKEIERIPAEIWRINEQKVVKTFMKEKPVKNIKIDPFLETGDVDSSNNTFPQKNEPSKFDQFKSKQ